MKCMVTPPVATKPLNLSVRFDSDRAQMVGGGWIVNPSQVLQCCIRLRMQDRDV